MNAQLINPILNDDWDRLIHRHPEATFFHSSAWAKVLSKTYGHEPIYLCCSSNNEPLALVPMMEVRSSLTGRRGVGLPFTDCCPPLFFQPEGQDLAIGALSDIARERKWRHFELRGGSVRINLCQQALCDLPDYYEHTLSLGGKTDEVFSSFSSSTRRAIRKAEKSGLRVETTQTREAMLSYYELHTKTRKRHGIPPQSLSFFLNIHEEVISQGLGFLVLAHLGTLPVAGAVYFHFGKNAVYKFGASHDVFQEYRGNNLVMWEAIQLLIRGGFDHLYFGRTARDNNGLRTFKLGWGTQEKNLTYLMLNTETGEWARKQDGMLERGVHMLAKPIFGKMPALLNSFAGALIYPHLD